MIQPESRDRLVRWYAVAVFTMVVMILLTLISDTLCSKFAPYRSVLELVGIALAVLNLVLVIVGCGFYAACWWIYGREPPRLLSGSVCLAMLLLFLYLSCTPAII